MQSYTVKTKVCKAHQIAGTTDIIGVYETLNMVGL